MPMLSVSSYGRGKYRKRKTKSGRYRSVKKAAARKTTIPKRNKKMIKSGSLRPEKKYFDVYASQNPATPTIGTIGSPVALTTDWQFQHLSWIDQGVTSKTRVGLKCRLKRHIMNMSVHNIADQLQNEYRIVIFLWQDEDIPQGSGAGNNPLAIFNNQHPMSLLNPTPPGGKWNILFDTNTEYLPASDTTAGFSNRSRRAFSWNKALDVIAEYGTAAGNDYHRGQLFVAFCAAANNNYTLYYESRVRFTDD